MIRLLLSLLWLGTIAYIVFIAPGARGAEDSTMFELFTMQEGQEPLLMAVFSWMGLWPLIFACLLLRKDDANIPAWPFVIASVGLGAFALLPYFIAASRKGVRANRSAKFVMKLASSKIIYLLLGGVAAGLLWLAAQGSIEAYWQAMQSSHFVHTMTIDFLILPIIATYAIYRDQTRDLFGKRKFPSIVGFIPMVGTLIYLWRAGGRH